MAGSFRASSRGVENGAGVMQEQPLPNFIPLAGSLPEVLRTANTRCPSVAQAALFRSRSSAGLKCVRENSFFARPVEERLRKRSRGAAKFVSPPRQRWGKWNPTVERQRRGTGLTHTLSARRKLHCRERVSRMALKGRGFSHAVMGTRIDAALAAVGIADGAGKLIFETCSGTGFKNHFAGGHGF